jgi:hypothetical protein
MKKKDVKNRCLGTSETWDHGVLYVRLAGRPHRGYKYPMYRPASTRFSACAAYQDLEATGQTIDITFATNLASDVF